MDALSGSDELQAAIDVEDDSEEESSSREAQPDPPPAAESPPTPRWACPVCYQNAAPCALGCGHLFCFPCASAVSACPLCRAPAVVAVDEVFIDRDVPSAQPNLYRLRGRGGLTYATLLRLFSMPQAERNASLIRSATICFAVYALLDDETYLPFLRNPTRRRTDRIKSTVDHLMKLGAPLSARVTAAAPGFGMSLAIRELVDHYAEAVTAWKGGSLLDTLMLSVGFGGHELAVANFAISDPQLRLSDLARSAAEGAVAMRLSR